MKNINLDTKKFKLFLERMEGKLTISEVNKNIILLESVIDDIIRAAKRVPVEATGVFSPQSISIVDKSLDEFFTEINKVLNGIKSGKSDINSLKNNLKAEDIISSNNRWKMFISRAVDQINLGNTPNVPGIKKNIFDYITSGVELNPAALSNEQISLITKYKAINKQYTDFIKHAEKIQKLTKNLTPESNLDDVVGQLLSESGIVSLEDIKKIFDDLEVYNTKYPDDDLTDIYDIFKQRFGLTSKNGDEIISTFKKSLRDNDVYKTLDLSLRQKIVKWFKTKLSKRISEINFELGKKVDWDNSLIYYNKKEDSFYVITTKNKEELDEVYKQITDQGFKPRKTDGSQGSKGFSGEDLTEKEKGAEYEKGARGERLRFKLLIYGVPIVILGTGSVVFCYYRFDKLRDKEALDRAGSDADAERGFFGVMTACIMGTTKDSLELAIEAGKNVFNTEIAPEFKQVEGNILLWLDQKCGRPSPEEPCQKCLDCDKDLDKEAIKKIKIKGSDGKEMELGQVFSNIDLFLNQDVLMPKFGSRYKDLIKQIKEDGKNGIISQYLTDDGKAIPLDEMILILCNKHSKQCVTEHYNRIIGEIINDSKNQDCNTYDSFMEERINILRQYNQSGVLSWGPSERAVDVSVNKDGTNIGTIKTAEGNTPFNGVSSIEQFLQRLEEYKINTKKFVCEEGDITTDEVETELISGRPIELMKELWESGEVRLSCDQWKTDLTVNRKAKLKITMGTVFNDYFVKVFPNIDWYGEDWDEAFNYWWDKQRSMCNITN